MKRMTAPGARVATSLALAGLTLGLLLLAPGAPRAAGQTGYDLQPLAQIGGMAGDVPIPKGLFWALGPLNDNGQFLADAGPTDGNRPDNLLQYTDGKFTRVFSPGTPGPVGPWPEDLVYSWPFSMNGRGNTVIAASHAAGAGMAWFGTFFRDAASGQTTAVALPGRPAIGNLTFANHDYNAYVINNRDEIAFQNGLNGPGSTPIDAGMFFRTPDGAVQPIFLPGEALPDGGTSRAADHPSISDSGVVAFLVQRTVDSPYSAYQWEKGNLTSLVTVGTNVPGEGQIAAVGGVFLNNRNSSALISAYVTDLESYGLYRLTSGTLTPLAVREQAMPRGGTFKNLLGVSAATEAGQHAFFATLADNTTGVYRVGLEG